jgi:hypothetical protein
VRDEIAAGVGDGNVHGLTDLRGLLLCGGDHSLGVSESKHAGLLMSVNVEYAARTTRQLTT